MEKYEPLKQIKNIKTGFKEIKKPMQPHTQIYFSAFGYDETDFIPSEISGEKAVDINHIFCRGMGGNPLKDKDRIENLIAVTRNEHIEYGDKKEYMPMMLKIHRAYLRNNGIYFSEEYFTQKLAIYEK